MSSQTWWQSAVVYQIYIRSFFDSSGDGTGDIAGIRQKLSYLSWLGVDAIWITPFYPSPQADHGYDVSDYRDVDPMFGTLDEFDELLTEAHELNIRVVIDIVPNHTSSSHPWFRSALSSRANPYRDRYIFRDPRSDGAPPNNWISAFGGRAWTLDESSDQFYLHLFAPEQPDLNWRNPTVHEEFDDVLRFWLNRGVDGFRIDVAHCLYKDEGLRDNPPARCPSAGANDFQKMEHLYDRDQPEVHEVHRRWRRIADEYPGDRVLVGEVFLFDPKDIAPYVRPDELHLAFNFSLLATDWDALGFRRAIEGCLREIGAVGATQTWVLSNHDVLRHATRYGGGQVGQERARAAALLTMALPGTTFIYMGDELGLEEADLPDQVRQDPVFTRSGGARKGRDGSRVPLPWTRDPPRFGFTEGSPWLPIPREWGGRSVALLRRDPDSILLLYRRAIALRKSEVCLQQGWMQWKDAPDSCLSFERRAESNSLVVVCNFSNRGQKVSCPGSLILASDPKTTLNGRLLDLSPNACAWVSSGSQPDGAE